MTLLIDPSDFLAAERAAREARRAEARAGRRALERDLEAAEAAFRAARAPACAADRAEVDQALDAVHELAELTDAFAGRSEATIERLRRADPGLVRPDPVYLQVLAEAVGDRLADRDLGRLYGAAVRRREADR